MKTQLLSFALVALFVTPAFAEMSLNCQSVKGALPKISLKAKSAGADDAGQVALKIDGHLGLIDDQQPSNDMGIDFGLKPSTREFSLSADLTSDDEKNVYIRLAGDSKSVQLAPESTDAQGAAKFTATLTGEITRYSHKTETAVLVRQVSNEVLSCHATWKN